MNGKLKITTEKGEIYFYTTCEYAYTKNDTAQIKFVYESDFRKYYMVVAVNRDKLALNITSTDDSGALENSFNVMTLMDGASSRHTTVEFEYFKFVFTPESAFVNYGKDFAEIMLNCSYSTLTQNPRATAMNISVKIPNE
ncbi:MAG: hypothetical protein J6R44_06025 [Clostridia bacterium]|nr:hypothetical protein [Clostridia bacterium]MBO7178169.1 hypothetical protein [Clostridia bacterium]